MDKAGPSRYADGRQQSGMTLIELLVVIGIVSILGAIAYPSYMQYVTRANRSTAHSALLQIADRQEQYFGDNKRYAAQLSLLGYASNTISINNEGSVVADSAADRIYQLSLTDAVPTSFTIRAVPQLRQAAHDPCLTLTLTHSGVKGRTGVGDSCW